MVFLGQGCVRVTWSSSGCGAGACASSLQNGTPGPLGNGPFHHSAVFRLRFIGKLSPLGGLGTLPGSWLLLNQRGVAQYAKSFYFVFYHVGKMEGTFFTWRFLTG